MEVTKKEGCCRQEGNAIVPPWLHCHLHLRDLHHRRISPQQLSAHCTIYTLYRTPRAILIMASGFCRYSYCCYYRDLVDLNA